MLPLAASMIEKTSTHEKPAVCLSAAAADAGIYGENRLLLAWIVWRRTPIMATHAAYGNANRQIFVASAQLGLQHEPTRAETDSQQCQIGNQKRRFLTAVTIG